MGTMVKSKKKTLVKKAAKEPQIVKYKDSKGNRWEARVGEPNGGFKIPGCDLVFSVQDMINWMSRNIAVVSPDTNAKIECGGDVTFSDGMHLVGESPKKKVKTQTVKIKGSDAIQVIIDQVKKALKKAPLTKKALIESTGQKETSVKKALETGIFQGVIQECGTDPKDKRFKLYSLA